MAWGEVDGWGWVYTVSFGVVYHLVVLAVAVAAHFLVRPLAKRSLLAERGAYLLLCYACAFLLPDLVKDLTGVASAGPLPHFISDLSSVLVFWRFIELVLGTAPLLSSSSSAFFFIMFIAFPGVEISIIDGKPEVPRPGWMGRRFMKSVRDMLCWMAAGTALGVVTQPSPLKAYAFAIMLSSALSCLGSPETLHSYPLLHAACPVTGMPEVPPARLFQSH